MIHTEPIEFDKQFMNTTVGRVILNDHLPEDMPYINGLLKKKGLGQLVSYCYLNFGLEVTVKMLDEVKDLGFLYATRAGISIGIDDMVVPDSKKTLVRDAEKEVRQRSAAVSGRRHHQRRTLQQGHRNLVGKSPKRSPTRCSGQMKSTTRTAVINPIYIMADSGARGSKQQIRQLSGMRGLMAKPSGEIIETPITANFREGLNVLQYFISTHGARKGLADTALKTADSGYLTRRLVDVAQDVIISEIRLRHRAKASTSSRSSKPAKSSSRCATASWAAWRSKIKDYEGNIIVDINQEITEDLAGGDSGGRYRAREDPLGADLRIEARRLRRCATAATWRPAAWWSAAKRSASSRRSPSANPARSSPCVPSTSAARRRESPSSPRIEAKNRRLGPLHRHSDGTQAKTGELIAMNRNGSIAVVDDKGREKERYPVVYGAQADGRMTAIAVKSDQVLVEWDPYTFSILTEVGGTVQFKDLQEGVTMHEQVDEVTGMSQLVVTDSPDEKAAADHLVRSKAQESASAT